MKAIFFAVLLIVGSFALHENGMELIQKMEKDDYGRELLNTIQLQVSSGDSADNLVKMLQDEEDKLQKEQDEEDKAILKLQNQCVEDLKKLAIEIAQTRTKIQQLSDLIKQLTPIKDGKVSAKKLAVSMSKKLKAKIKDMDEERDEKQKAWNKEKAEHDRLTAVIQAGKTILQSALSSSFLQTGSQAQAHKQALIQLSNHFNKARRIHTKHKSINAIFRILAQFASQAPKQTSESVTDKIFKLIQDLLDKVAESRAKGKKDFDGWMGVYHKSRKIFVKKLQEETSKINQLKMDISVLNKRILIASKELKEQKIRLEQKIQQHDEREKECDRAAGKYAKDREARDNQRGIVSDAIGLLVSKIRLLKRYVGERVKSLKKPFD